MNQNEILNTQSKPETEDQFAIQGLLALSYHLQQNPIAPALTQELSALITLDISLDSIDRPTHWCMCVQGQIQPSLRESIEASWFLVELDQKNRKAIDATSHDRQPTHQIPALQNPNLKTINQQLEAVLDQEPSEMINHHLLIVLDRATSTDELPKSHLVQHFASITVLAYAPTIALQLWQKWVVEQGGKLMIYQNSNPNESFDSELCARFEKSIYVSQKPRVYLKLLDGYQAKSQYALTPQCAPLTWEGDICVLRADVLSQKSRASWLIDFQAPAQKSGIYQWGNCRLNQRDFPLTYEVAQQISEIQNQSPSVSFAKQINQRHKSLELMLASYQKQELRKVLQQIDMFLKLHLALNDDQSAKHIYEIKVVFLTLGKFTEEDFQWMLKQFFSHPFYMTHAGEWKRSIQGHL